MSCGVSVDRVDRFFFCLFVVVERYLFIRVPGMYVSIYMIVIERNQEKALMCY